MNRLCFAVLTAIWCNPAAVEPFPTGQVQLLPPRWRATQQVLQHAAEQADFRWAMPATISRRAFLGTLADKTIAADVLVADLCRQTGLECVVLNRVVVVHVRRDDLLAVLIARLSGKDAQARLSAVAQLGWLQDARAWPLLAGAIAGDDLQTALAAAHALRRLDGEKDLDWRLVGVSDSDPELTDINEPVPAWQVPLARAFPDCVPLEQIRRLAASTYIPLRESAARLAAGSDEPGRQIAQALAQDPSPIVRQAAKRSLAAWAEPQRIVGQRPLWTRAAGSSSWFERPAPDLKAAAAEFAASREHDTVWRLTGRRVGYQGTPEAIALLDEFGRSDHELAQFAARPLAEFCGGPIAIAHLRWAVLEREPSGSPGWGQWGLSSLVDGQDLAEALAPVLVQGQSHWSAPAEYTAARWAGIHAVPSLIKGLPKRGHWVCLALGHIGGPDAAETLIAHLDDKDPGVAVAAAKALGESCSLDGVAPLIRQLDHHDRLRRHWAVLGLGRIGGPQAATGLVKVLEKERARKDHLVRRAAAELICEIGPLDEHARELVVQADEDHRRLVPEYRPRNPRLGDGFPVGRTVEIPEHRPVTYCSIGETRQVMDWANRLLIRYGGCTGAYSNECFAFDVGSTTWFPIRAADHYCHLPHEIRPNPGCSRGMVYDDVHHWVWIGQGIGGSSGPTQHTHLRNNGLAAYDAALDRYIPCENASRLPMASSGEPHKGFAFDGVEALVIGSKSAAAGIAALDTVTGQALLRPGPADLPSLDHYPPPAMAFDPISGCILCTHPKLDWRLVLLDVGNNSFRYSTAVIPGQPEMKACGGLVYDSLNRQMLLIGGEIAGRGRMPMLRYDRQQDVWIDLKVENPSALHGSDGHTVYDPEHNLFLGLFGGAYRYRQVPVGTKGLPPGSGR